MYLMNSCFVMHLDKLLCKVALSAPYVASQKRKKGIWGFGYFSYLTSPNAMSTMLSTHVYFFRLGFKTGYIRFITYLDGFN